MGSRPSTHKAPGGGFFTGDGVFLTYKWTDEFNGKPFEPGMVKDKVTGRMKPRHHALYCLITVQLDSGDAPISRELYAGNWDKFLVSEDGKTLTDPEGGECSLNKNTGASKFFTSWTNNGFDEMLLSADDAIVNYEPMEGYRIRLGKAINEEAKKEGRKREDKKTGKLYDIEDIVVEEVYTAPAAQAKASVAPKAAKPAKAAPKAAKAGNGAAVGASEEQLSPAQIVAKSVEVIQGVVVEKGAKTANGAGLELEKRKLAVPILTRWGGASYGKDIYKNANDDAFLAEHFTYDPVRQMVTVS